MVVGWWSGGCGLIYENQALLTKWLLSDVPLPELWPAFHHPISSIHYEKGTLKACVFLCFEKAQLQHPCKIFLIFCPLQLIRSPKNDSLR